MSEWSCIRKGFDVGIDVMRQWHRYWRALQSTCEGDGRLTALAGVEEEKEKE
uniref:Uncharacterized protein n=1 Tax=Cucumis melo TaxID=3656 RepID=A0A9I9CV86_CUCME